MPGLSLHWGWFVNSLSAVSCPPTSAWCQDTDIYGRGVTHPKKSWFKTEARSGSCKAKTKTRQRLPNGGCDVVFQTLRADYRRKEECINNKSIWVWHSEHCGHELEQQEASSSFLGGSVGLSSADSAGTSCKLSAVNRKTLEQLKGSGLPQTNPQRVDFSASFL